MIRALFGNMKMKVSEVTEKQLLAMTPEQKWEFVCGGIKDEGESADYALLLGTMPSFSAARAHAAARLYLEGRVKYIVPTGGVEWEYEGETLSEAHYMKRILLSEGVPEEAIIIENEATTTKENMFYSVLQINRRTKFYGGKRVMIVTSLNHMKRSVALAKSFLPRFVEITYSPSAPDLPYEECMRDTSRLDSGIHLMWGLVHNGIVEDFEIGFDI
ncbi:MAG: YdcF family protein [Ruminococcaceae bacterium]|nr:YdcF family protein [Oscillospiraceae bacterium]